MEYMITNDWGVSIAGGNGFDYEEMIKETIDVIGHEILDYPEFKKLENLDWTNKAEVEKMAKIFEKAYEEDMFVVENI